nr:MAG TPA: hypothetical protein [Bacteriophage sp.]
MSIDTESISGLTTLIGALYEGTKDNKLCYMYNYEDRLLVSVSPVAKNRYYKTEEIEELLQEIEQCKREKVIYHVERKDIEEWSERKLIEVFAYGLVKKPWEHLLTEEEKDTYGIALRELVKGIRNSGDAVMELKYTLIKKLSELKKDNQYGKGIWYEIEEAQDCMREIEGTEQKVNKGRLIQEIERAYKEMRNKKRGQ